MDEISFFRITSINKEGNMKPQTINDDVYETSDLALATVLFTLGHEVIDVDKSNPRRSIFIFPYSEKVEEDASKFWNSKLSLEPKLLLANMKTLKTRIYS